MSLMGMPYIVLMPVFARDVLHGGPSALGFLMGASGVGALAGAVYLASRRSVLGLGKMIPIGAGVFGLGLIAFTLSRDFIWSLILLTAVGFGQMIQLATSNTLLQTMVDDDRRGRVMGFFTVAFVGMTPLGSLLAGALASVDWRTVDSFYRRSRYLGRRWGLCPQAPAIEREDPSNLCHKRNSP